MWKIGLRRTCNEKYNIFKKVYVMIPTLAGYFYEPEFNLLIKTI